MCFYIYFPFLKFTIDFCSVLCYNNLRMNCKFAEALCMKQYMTEKRKMLISFLSGHKSSLLSAEEIHGQLENMSLSAVYRNLTALCENGFVRKSFAKDGHTALYQYCERQKCASHLHMKCNMCGRMQCVDKAATDKIISVLGESSGFLVDEPGTVIYGMCGSCVGKNNGGNL